MKKDKKWLKKEVFELYPKYGAMYVSPDYETVAKTETISKVLELIDQLDEPQKSVIPQFVADWIECKKQPDWDYDKKEDALADSIHFTLYSLHTNYPETNPDVVLRKPINDWLNDDRKNYWKLIDGVRYGYEVEKEKLYRVRAGNRYVRFNLDGSIIGVKKDNSIVCLERLAKLPFDYKKAVESGIITLEEVME